MKQHAKSLSILALLTAAAGAGCQTATTSSNLASSQPERIAKSATVTPFLMFQDGRAEEAINTYIDIFGDARVVHMTKYGPNPVGAKEDSIQQAVFQIFDQRIMVTESPIKHTFDFNPAISLFVDFTSEAELDRVFAELSADGFVMMPPDNYGFSTKFAFIQDRFGVSWQLNLPAE